MRTPLQRDHDYLRSIGWRVDDRLDTVMLNRHLARQDGTWKGYGRWFRLSNVGLVEHALLLLRAGAVRYLMEGPRR